MYFAIIMNYEFLILENITISLINVFRKVKDNTHVGSLSVFFFHIIAAYKKKYQCVVSVSIMSFMLYIQESNTQLILFVIIICVEH